MKKALILGLILMSSKVFAVQGAHCVRGGSVVVNLPSNAYYLYVVNSAADLKTLSIFEKNSADSRGDLILKKTLSLQNFDPSTLRRTYLTSDGRTSLTTNENQDGKILSAYVTGTGEGLNPKRPFAFETRSCGQFE